jgi:hypothetical protein
MLYEDKYGRILSEEEIDELSVFDIEEREIHVYLEGEDGLGEAW